MEPFRILVDRKVCQMDTDIFDTDAKRQLQNLLNEKVQIAGKEYTALDAISIYSKSVFNALNTGDLSLISFYEL